jgi:hypothetical protein
LVESVLGMLKEIFLRPRCTKLIKYQGNKIEFGATVDAASTKFSLVDFKYGKEKLYLACEAASALDDCQFYLCRISREVPRESEEWMKLLKLRSAAIMNISSVRVIMAALKKNPRKQTKELDQLIDDMQNLSKSAMVWATDVPPLGVLAARCIMTKSKKVSIKSQPSEKKKRKKAVKTMHPVYHRITIADMKPVSLALKRVGIDEKELDLMIKKLP